MRIGCLQFKPELGQREHNVERVKTLLYVADPSGLDLLMLPELALTGYNFPNLSAIEPFLEPTASGPSTAFAKQLAKEHECYVSLGYPEKASETERYNSVVVVSPDGIVAAHYRKTFLYYTDETWANEPAKGFAGGAAELPHLGKICQGICMDVNPYKFDAPWTAYEFGSHVAREKPDLVLLTMAWLDAAPMQIGEQSERPTEYNELASAVFSKDTLAYWLDRLTPLLERQVDEAEAEKEVLVAICNRAGTEPGARYVGSSIVMGLTPAQDLDTATIQTYGLIGRGEEGLLVADTDVPLGKLVLSKTMTA